MLRAAFAEEQPPGRAGLEAIRGRLRGLRDHMASHFVQEEQGGYLEESIARIPRLSAAVKAVMAEHPGLLAEIDSLLECLAVRDIHGESWSAAGRRFAAFADHLIAHERNENAMVQQGYNEDFGLPD